MKHFYSKALGHAKHHALRMWIRLRRWRLSRRHMGLAALMAGGTTAAILFLVAGLTLRLLIGPISLGPFAGAIEDTLNASINGLVVHFDRANLEWSQSEGRVNLTILGAKVFDLNGRIVAQAPKAELDFDAGALLTGHAELKRFALIGVQLTAVRTREGAIRLGFRSREGESDLLKTIADALRYNGKTFAAWGRGQSKLDRFAILNARIAFHDEPTDLFLVSPSASLTVKNNGNLLDASLDAAIEISGVRANLIADAELNDDGMPRHGAVEIHGLSLTALAANSLAFAGLAPFGLTLDLTGNVDLQPDGTIRTLDFGVSGKGVAGRPKIDPVVIGIDNFRMLGRFDGATKRLVLDELTIDGDELKAKANGHLDVGWDAGTLTALTGELDVENVAFNIPDRFSAPVMFERMALRGAYDRAAGKITVDNAVMSAGPLQANIKGAITLAGEQSPALDFDGTINAIAVRDFLHFWPVGLAEGARSWVDANISQGHLGQATIDLDIPAGALDQDALPENSMSVAFPFSGVTAQYIKGLTKLTSAQGQGHLSGDAFRADITQAAVGPLAVSKGVAVIPNLHLPVTQGTISAQVTGKVPDVLSLIDERPLGYPTRFHIDPKATSGDAVLALNFTIPMLKDLKVEQLGIAVQAKTSNLSLPIGEKRRIDNAALAFTIDGKSLTAQGPVQMSGVPLQFKWVEDFNPSPITTRVDVQGTLDDAARAKLGLPDAGFIFGPSQISLTLAGHRAQFSSGTLRADLHDAVIDVPPANIQKPAGQPATISANIHFGANTISIKDLTVAGNGLDVHGNLDLDEENNVIAANFPAVHVGTADDFSFAAKTGADGALALHIVGCSLDASHIFASHAKAAKPQAQAPEETHMKQLVSVDAKLDRVLLKEGVTFSGFSMSVALGANEHLQSFTLDTVEPGNEAVTGRLAVQPDGVREISFEAGDAGALIRGLTGFTGVRKGTLFARATFPQQQAANSDAAVDYKGTIVVRDFILADQPFAAHTHTSASSAQAQSSGILFDKLEAPFSAHGKIVTISDGRGSGSSTGMSFEGTIDRRLNTVNISGTLVPMFGINSVLGDVPLLGNVLASRKGEGVIGITYAVRGDIDQPAFMTNPLSVLTPGILRRIFEYGAGTPSSLSPRSIASAEPPTANTVPIPAAVEITPLVPVPKPKPDTVH